MIDGGRHLRALLGRPIIALLVLTSNLSETDLNSPKALVNDNAMFYETFICFCISEAKLLCFSLCSQMFDDVERC